MLPATERIVNGSVGRMGGRRIKLKIAGLGKKASPVNLARWDALMRSPYNACHSLRA